MWWRTDSKRRVAGGAQNNFPALGVPRKCPFFLLVAVCLKEGEASGSEKEGVRI
jgi:hypothetical protein